MTLLNDAVLLTAIVCIMSRRVNNYMIDVPSFSHYRLMPLLGYEDINQNLRTAPRIVGGSSTTIQQVPYQASIQLRGYHFCGGTIISKNHILTAAHCLRNKPEQDLKVRVGTTFRQSGGIVRGIRKAFSHPFFDADKVTNDVAVLKLKCPLTFDRYIQPIFLASYEFWQPGSLGFVTGWGVLNEDDTFDKAPYNLQGVMLQVKDMDQCRTKYPASIISDDKICVGSVSGMAQDSCQGDSGGPLVISGVLAGIVSYGDGCAFEDTPGFYVSIPKVLNFIGLAASL